MLSPCLRNLAKCIPKVLIQNRRVAITTTKTLAERKKKIYESQLSENMKANELTQSKRVEQKREREAQFEQTLFDMGKEMIETFTSINTQQKKNVEIVALLKSHHKRLAKQHKTLEIRELLHYNEIVKGMCFMRLEQLDHIDIVYKELAAFMNQQEHKKAIKEFLVNLWKDNTPVQMKIRLVSLLQYMDEQDRNNYLTQIVPLIRYFKSSEMLILLYEKWRFKYSYSYELIDQIHNNQYYQSIEDINQAYFKMLFVETIKGEFGPNDDAIYSRTMNSINDKPNLLAHSAFSKLIKMLHSQNYFVQTQSSRSNLEFSLNGYINIAKNQNYDEKNLDLQQLVEIYLGFEESSSTGEILLNQITYFSRISNFQISKQNFELYQKLLLSVLKNIKIKLKYERRDFLNKQYTNDTINFLREFVPKYLQLWPEVIFELNNASYELFRKNDDEILIQFVKIFEGIIKDKKNQLSLKNIPFLGKVLKFLKAYESKKLFTLPQDIFLTIVKELEAKSSDQITNQELEILYLTLSLLGERIKEPIFKSSIIKINSKIIEASINRQISKSREVSLINSLDDEIIWLSLCSALIKSHNFQIDESLIEVFVNQKLFFMINSLNYLEVYEILNFTIGLSRIKAQVYERLLYNLSTFVIYINERNNRQAGSPFYLNHKYVEYYPKICKLILENQSVFRAIDNKVSFRIMQIMFYKNIEQYENEDILKLLEILSDPSFLISSLTKHIEDIKFSASQLESYENSRALKSFQYYNKSLLRFFEGKYNECEIKSRLRGDTLTKQQIQEYFSKIEVYKTIIMDGELNIRFDMPEPQTNIPDFKYMYTCQRIFQRVKMFNQFDFKQDMKYKADEEVQFKDVDFDAEKKYINKEVLIPNITFNEFRLENRILPRYIKLQVWKSYVFYEKSCQIDPKDFELNQRKLIDQILNKVIKGGIYGNYEKIKEVYREFNPNEEVISALKEAKIVFEERGSAIEFKCEETKNPLFILLCSNNTNYKILYICAHFIAKKGIKVAIIKENQKIEPLLNFLKQHFSPKIVPQVAGEGDNIKQEENESENQE